MACWNLKVSDEELIFLRKLGFSTAEIARTKQMHFGFIYLRLKKLSKENYIIMSKANGNALKAYKRCQSEESNASLLKALQENGGYLPAAEAKQHGTYTYNRLANIGAIIRIDLNISHNVGNYKRFIAQKIIKKCYYKKTYVCLNRTALVRLLSKVCLKPKTKGEKHVLTTFLRYHLSKAETIAVLWKLGIRKWSHNSSLVKRNMQIDGIVKPRNRLWEVPA